MRFYLAKDSDTRLYFKTRGDAFKYAEKNNIPSFIVTEYDADFVYKYSLYNPFLKCSMTEGFGKVSYFNDESELIKTIASFI